jgi:hypothetical protein
LRQRNIPGYLLSALVDSVAEIHPDHTKGAKVMGTTVERINPALPNQRELVTQILKLLAEIKFGSIEIIIHDGKVTLIERKEKIKPTAEH